MKLHIEDKKSSIYIVHENGLKVGRINNISDAETIVKRVNEHEKFLDDVIETGQFAVKALEEHKKEIEKLQSQNRELVKIVNSYKDIANRMVDSDVDDYGNYAIEVMNLDEELEKLLKEVEQ